jgi:hypothetical protein
MSIVSRVPIAKLQQLIKVDKEALMTYEQSVLSMALKPIVTAFQVRPAAARIVNNTQLNYVPHAMPKMLKQAAVVSASRPETGDRLVGDIAAIGWFWADDTMHLCVQSGPTERYEGGNFYFAHWRPSWSGEDLARTLDISDAPFVTDLDRQGYAITAQAVRFLVTFAIVLGAEQTPLRVENEKPRKGAPKGASPQTTWVTRHVYLSEQPTSHKYPSKEETEAAQREGFTLEEIEVRGFIRRQRHGPGNSLVKEIYIKGFLSHRWVAADKKRRIVVH